MGYKVVEQNEDYEVWVDSDMPEWFIPREVADGYLSGDGNVVNLCDVHWYTDNHDPLRIARDAIEGYWWVEKWSPQFDRLVRATSAAGYGLRVYKDLTTAKEYRLEE